MSDSPEDREAAKLYAALTREELVARCVSKDATIRILRLQVEVVREKAARLERRLIIDRSRI